MLVLDAATSASAIDLASNIAFLGGFHHERLTRSAYLSCERRPRPAPRSAWARCHSRPRSGRRGRKQALVQDLAGRMVVSPRAVRQARWTISISRSSPSAISASTASSTSTLLQGQGQGQRLPDGTEEAVRRQRRHERPHHVRRRGRPGRSRRRQAHRRRSRTITNGSRPRSSSAATRSASTPARPASPKSSTSLPSTACAG